VRVLFLLLLLANLLFLAWSRWVVVPAQAVREAPASASRLQPIRLQQEAGPAASANSLPADLVAASCVSVGPFLEQAQADAVAATLQRLGFTSRPRAAVDEVRVGYWVRVPNMATAEDAGNAIATLQAAGLADAYVVTDEGPDNTVSIGVYADPKKAAEVAGVATRVGFTPETSDRLRTLDVIWLDIDRQANGSIPALEDLGAPPEGGLPLDLRACPSSGTDAPPEAPAPESTQVPVSPPTAAPQAG
jgi:hypothetical protein